MATEQIREFVMLKGDNSDARVIKKWDDEYQTIFVAEVVHDMKITDVDEDDVECSERDRNRQIVENLHVPLFCCKSPHRKLPPRTPIEALRKAAEKGLEGLAIGMQVMLCGEIVTL